MVKKLNFELYLLLKSDEIKKLLITGGELSTHLSLLLTKESGYKCISANVYRFGVFLAKYLPDDYLNYMKNSACEYNKNNIQVAAKIYTNDFNYQLEFLQENNYLYYPGRADLVVDLPYYEKWVKENLQLKDYIKEKVADLEVDVVSEIVLPPKKEVKIASPKKIVVKEGNGVNISKTNQNEEILNNNSKDKFEDLSNYPEEYLMENFLQDIQGHAVVEKRLFYFQPVSRDEDNPLYKELAEAGCFNNYDLIIHCRTARRKNIVSRYLDGDLIQVGEIIEYAEQRPSIRRGQANVKALAEKYLG